MIQVRVPVILLRFGMLWLLVLSALCPLRAIEQFKSFASLPLDSSPAPTLFQGQDGNLYGILEYTDINHEEETNGVVYQLSTTGSLTVLYRFPWSRNGEPNATGSEPSYNLTMGKDGFLYGFTKYGGAHGGGTFYRLSVNREYSVLAHLPPTINGSSFRGLVIGPDQAAYTMNWDEGLVRIGFDGSVQVVAPEYKHGGNKTISAFNQDGSELLITWSTGHWINFVGPVAPILHMRVLDLPSLTVKQSQEIEYFPAPEYEARIIAVRADEILVYSPPPHREPYGPGRVVSFDRAGNAAVIAVVESTSNGGTSIPPIQQTLVARDGTIFYTTGQQTKGEFGLAGGTEIHWLKRNGEFKKIADLDGYPLAGWCEGAEGNNLYGVSWGSVVMESEETESTGDVSALRALRTPLAASAGNISSSAIRSSTRVRRAAFRYQTDPTNGNFLPLAKADRYVSPASRNLPSQTLAVLRNDRDLENDALDIIEVAAAKNGVVAIVPGVSGKPPVLAYTPDEGPRLSDTFTYTIEDAQGGKAVGQVSIRGELKGKFRGADLGQTADGELPAVSVDGMNLTCANSGRFSGMLNLNGRSIGLTGRLGADDAAHVFRRFRDTGDVVVADLQLININGVRNLQFKITFLGKVIEGVIPAL